MIRRGFGRAGRPGLVGTMARTAVIAGTATAVSGGVARHQQERAEGKAQAEAYQQQQQYGAPQQQYQPQQQYAPPAQPEYMSPPPAAAGADDLLDKLQQLGDLKDRGLLTDAEFQAQKARLLGS